MTRLLLWCANEMAETRRILDQIERDIVGLTEHPSMQQFDLAQQRLDDLIVVLRLAASGDRTFDTIARHLCLGSLRSSLTQTPEATSDPVELF